MEAAPRKTRNRLLWSGLAVVVVALFLGAFTYVGLLVGIYLLVMGGVVAAGFWLVSTGNRAAVVTGYVLVSITVPAIVYAVLAFPVYLTFYAAAPFDRHADTAVTAFKVAFWAAYAAHVLLTVIISPYVPGLRRVPLLSALLGTISIVAAASLPTLAFLSWWNSCSGIEYPFGGMSCG
jgi:hypothetical protein